MYIDFGFILNIIEVILMAIIAFSLVLLLRYKREVYEFKKREYSANFIKDWNHLEIIESLYYAQKSLGSQEMSQKQLQNYIEHDDELYLKLTKLLNFFEEMAQSIDSGLSDEEYLKRYFLVTSINTYHNFKAFIYLQRHKLSTEQPFISFEKLVYKWEREYKNEELLPRLKVSLK